MKQYLLLIVLSLIVGATVYGLSNEQNPYIIIEQQNRKEIIDCMDKTKTFTGSSRELQKQIEICSNITLKYITWMASGTPESSVPSQWYTKKYSLVLSGSHDYRVYSDRLGASWKNNNSAGLTWWVSNTLKNLWNNAWIRYRKGSPRPANEKGYYIYFETVEDGLRAKIIAIRERWWKATVSHFLAGWWTDNIKLSFDKSKIIENLSEEEFTELFIQQMKKESPGYTSQLVKDWILIIE